MNIKKPIFKNSISAVLVLCLTVTGMMISGFSNTTVQAAAKASLSKCTITVPSLMGTYNRFPMTMTGDRQTAKGSAEGETRYVPYTYTVKHSSGTINGPKLKPNSSKKYVYNIQFTDPGTKTIEVTWLYQQYKKKKWVTTSKPKTKKSISIKRAYTTKLNANGGKLGTTSIKVVKGYKYNALKSLPTPSRSNYTFKGWYTKTSGGSKINNSTKVSKSSNHTLYARWEKKNNSTPAPSTSGTKASLSKSTITVPSTMATYSRFPLKITGHRQTASGAKSGETRYVPYTYSIKHSTGTIRSSQLRPNSSKTYVYNIQFTDPGTKTVEVTWLYQKYSNKKWVTTSKPKSKKSIKIEKSNTVSLNANGGSVGTKTIRVVRGKNYNKLQSLPTPSRSGYTFKGWYTRTSNGTKVSNTTKVSSTGNHTLYAIWTKNSSGGSSTSTPTLLPSYNSTAKNLVKRIGKQGPSQCAAYCMLYCTAIKDKKQIKPSQYLQGNLAVWYKGGMQKKLFSTQTSAFSEVTKQLRRGYPCIIRTNYNKASQHWVTVVGCVKGGTKYSDLYVLDPAGSDPSRVLRLGDTKYYFPTSGEKAVASFY